MPHPHARSKAWDPVNALPWETRVRIVAALTEGNSLRATARLVGVSKNAVMHFALRVGEGCEHLHNRLVRGIGAPLVECDERWSFIGKKEARVEPGVDPAEWGDVYTFVALDAVTKLVIAYYVGKRDQPSTDAFIIDLRSRLTVVPHLSTDGFSPYAQAVGASFLGVADYGMVVKNYSRGAQRGPDHRYEPPRDPFITKTAVQGAPDLERLSTSHVERNNLTMRHTVGRTRRLCLAFSKTLRGHRAAEALGFAAYNFVRVCGPIGMTPAMSAGIVDRPWTVAELMDAALAEVPVDKPTPQPLALPPGRAAQAARALPNGRGWLRAVDGGKGAPPAAPAPAAPAAPRGVQLDLFGLDLVPPKGEE